MIVPVPDRADGARSVNLSVLDDICRKRIDSVLDVALRRKTSCGSDSILCGGLRVIAHAVEVAPFTCPIKHFTAGNVASVRAACGEWNRPT